MTLNLLSGNFQPLTPVSGRPLPQAEIESNSSANEVNVPDKVESQPKPEQNDIAENRDNRNQEIQQQIRSISELSQSVARRILFQVDDDSGATIVKIIDRDTDKLIRQIPPEELLRLSKRLKELNEENTQKVGVFLQQEV